MAKFKVTKDEIKRAELFKTVVNAPIWLPTLIKTYKKDKAADGSNLHKYTLTVLSAGNPEIDQYTGLTLFMQFSEKQLGFMGPLLTGLKCPVDADGNFEFERFEDVLEKRVEAFVVPGMYEGKKKNEIEDFRPMAA